MTIKRSTPESTAVRRTTVHTNLTDEEFLALRKTLLDERTTVSAFFGRCAREYLNRVTQQYLAQSKKPNKIRPNAMAEEARAE